MQVLVLNSVPVGLRGDVTRWFMEIAPGVYVGNVSARNRDALWERILALSGRGRALLVYPARNEQGYVVRTYQYDWEPADFDGLTLMLRPYERVGSGKPLDAVVNIHEPHDSQTDRRVRDTDKSAGDGNDSEQGHVEAGLVSEPRPSVPTDIPPRGWSTAARRRAMRRK